MLFCLSVVCFLVSDIIIHLIECNVNDVFYSLLQFLLTYFTLFFV
nr:MAG TPA: hypothetical protein [Caudoviricetes sp.]